MYIKGRSHFEYNVKNIASILTSNI